MSAALRTLMLLPILVTLVVAQQTQEDSRPIERENLIEALKTGNLPENKAIEVIARRKLNFVMTAEYEKEFRDLKAGEALVDALWKNDAFEVKQGAPMTKDAIVTLLETGVPSPRVEKIVQVRKADMVLDAAASKEVRDAGGSATLLGVILTNVVAVEQVGPQPAKTQPSAEDASMTGAIFLLDPATQTLKRLADEPWKRKIHKGFGKIQDILILPGQRSPFRISSGNEIAFVYKSTKDEDVQKALLFAFIQKKDVREYVLRQTDLKGRPTVSKSGIPLAVTKIGASSYKLTPTFALGTGEYGISNANKITTFGVDFNGR